MAGKPIGKVAMTATERQRRWRARVRDKKLREQLAVPHAPRPISRTHNKTTRGMRNRIEPGEIFAAIHRDKVQGSRTEEAVFRSLAEKHCIPRHLIDQVCASLSDGTSAYRHARSVQQEGPCQPSYPDIKGRLSRIAGLLAELRSAIEQLPDEVKGLFDLLEWGVTLQMLEGTSQISCFGHRFYRGLGQDGQGMAYLHLPQIMANIDVLENMIEHIRQGLKPANKGGRPPNEAMWLWVGNFRDIWTRKLGRRFTFRQHKGEPTSPAGVVCWEALRLIDPDASRSEFRTAMRQAVELGRPGRGRPRRS
jgi:hypothetical protein